MQVADLGDAEEDLLPVQLDEVAQRAVRGGVRRPQVQEHRLPGFDPGEALRVQPAAAFQLVGEIVRLGEPPHLVDVVVLAQRMAPELAVVQHPLQVRVPVEADPVHVEDLALPPVRGAPEARGGRDVRLLLRDGRADGETFPGREVVELVDEVEPLLVPLRPVVHAGDVDELVHAQAGIVPHEPQGVEERLPRHAHLRHAPDHPLLEQGRAEVLPQAREIGRAGPREGGFARAGGRARGPVRRPCARVSHDRRLRPLRPRTALRPASGGAPRRPGTLAGRAPSASDPPGSG